MPLATENDLPYIFNRLKDAKAIVYDAETSGLDFKRNHIVGHVISFTANPSDSFYCPVRHLGDKNLFGRIGPTEKTNWDGTIEPFEKELINLLNRPDLTIIGQNLAFDLKFMSRIGNDLSAQYQDTIINAPLLNEWSPRFNLEYLANEAGLTPKLSKVIDEHIYRTFPDVTEKPMGHFWRLAGNDPVAVDYACGDGVTTFELRNWQLPRLEKENLLRVWRVENKLIPILARMSIRGIKIDEEYLNQLQIYVESKIDELSSALPEGFNARSRLQMEEYCRQHGATNWPLTPTGKPSFAENWLDSFEAGQKIVQLRKLMTLMSMFILPLKETHIFNGRVHTTFNQLRGDDVGIITGRISSQDPSLQQIPKRDKKLGPIFRAAFIPDDGLITADPDYSQLEPRILAHYTEIFSKPPYNLNPVLLNAYRTDPNTDAHQAVADAAGIERTWGKNANMTIINSGGRNVLMSKYHVPPDKVDALLRDYFAAMPEIRKLQKLSENVMRERGYVVSLLGRRARLRSSGKAYTGLNRLLQVGNADILKLKMVEVDDYLAANGRPIELLNTVHDALLMQFEPGQAHHYKECLNIFTQCGPNDEIKLAVPLKVNTTEGPNWSIATYGDDARPLIDAVRSFKPDPSKRRISMLESLMVA